MQDCKLFVVVWNGEMEYTIINGNVLFVEAIPRESESEKIHVIQFVTSLLCLFFLFFFNFSWT